MSDPKRWRETEDGETRELVATLAAATPTPEMREAVWSKIAPTLPPGSGPGSGGAPGGGAPGPVAGSLGAKIVAGGIAVIAAGAIASWAARAPEPVASTRSSASASPSTIAATPSAAPSHEVPVSPVASASTLPSPAPIAPTRGPARSAAVAEAPSALPAPPLSSADRLREESEGVRRARQLLRDKNPAGALAELDRLARLYPSGPLEEEREVLTIESVASSGRKDEARRRAERFLFERPRSVHAARVRELAQP